MIKELDQELGYGQVIDLNKRTLNILGKEAYVYSNSFLSSSSEVIHIISNLSQLATVEQFDLQVVLDHLTSPQYSFETDIKKIALEIFNGLVVLIIDGVNQAIVIDLRDYPGRSIGEPDVEKVVRGSRDGFTESVATNVALVRRRIKSGQLRSIQYQIGDYSKTLVVLLYLENFVDHVALEEVKTKLSKAQITDLTMSDKALEELIIPKLSIYPMVRYTERPDTVAVHLYQGMFAILVDTSPSVIVAPATLFDHMQHAEEYRQSSFSGTYLRIIRFLGIIASFFLIPLWFALSISPWTNYGYFNLFFGDDFSKTELFFQLIIAEVGIELLRMASIHTPSSLSTSMGLIAGIVIGEIALTLGLFTETIVFLGAISAVGTYITPSYELSLANKLIKLGLIIMIYLFGFYGLIIGCVILLIYLLRLKSFNKPYLSPLWPLDIRKLIQQFIRKPYKNKKQ